MGGVVHALANEGLTSTVQLLSTHVKLSLGLSCMLKLSVTPICKSHKT